ncbi:MAG: flavin reductase family protein [Pseudomonadota bacterium]
MYSWAPITGDIPQTLDAQRFRKALGSFPTGICLVTTVTEDGKREGMTINSFASVSLAPPLILWSIRDDARSSDAFLTSRTFVLSVLAAGQAELAMHFAKPALDKFESCEDAFEAGIGGCPRLRHSVATYECSVYSRHQEGDHTILLGRVQAFSDSDDTPLMFHAGKMGSMHELAAAEISGHRR